MARSRRNVETSKIELGVEQSVLQVRVLLFALPTLQLMHRHGARENHAPVRRYRRWQLEAVSDVHQKGHWGSLHLGVLGELDEHLRGKGSTRRAWLKEPREEARML